MSPYWNNNFFEFFVTFFSRIPSWITGSFAHDEIQIFALFLISICCSYLGCYLVYRKMSMMANSLSHTTLVGIVSIFLLMQLFSPNPIFTIDLPFGLLILAAFITSLVTYFFTLFLSEKLKVQEDAGMGLVFTFLFALGIILLTMYTKNAHIGIEIIMGNIDAIHQKDLSYLFWVTLITLGSLILFHKELFLSTFDAALAKSYGFSPTILNFLIMILSSIVITGGFRSVGLILILNFLIAPVVIARNFTSSWNRLLLLSISIGCVVSFIAVAISRHMLSEFDLPLSTSGIISFIYFLVFFILVVARSIKPFAGRQKVLH